MLKLKIRPAEQQAPKRNAFAGNLAAFVWIMTGWRQVYVCGFAVFVALVNFVPIELQRRIVDDAIIARDVPILVWLGVLYAAVVLGHVALKFVLLVLQSWLGESAVKHARDDLLVIANRRDGAATEPSSAPTAGQTVTVIGSEVDKLGGFVGEHLSQAVVNGTFLVAIVAYMVIVEPRIALYSLAVLIPQAILTPYLQERLNRLVERHLGLVRQLGDQVVEREAGGSAEATHAAEQSVAMIFRNRIRFYVLKYGLKSLLNLVNALGPMIVLLVGGWMAIHGQTTVGTIVAFVSGFERMAQPLRELIAFYRVAAQSSVQLRMINSWIEAQPERR